MEELLRAGKARGSTLLVASAGPRIKRIIELAGKSGVEVSKAQASELDRLAPDNRGATLVLREVPQASELDLSDWLSSKLPEHAMVVVLDHIEDPHNLGAILRSADVFGVDLVIMPERRAARETDTVARASAGALAYVPVATVSNLARALEALKDKGFWTYAADMGGQSLLTADLPRRVVLVMGSEGSGVSRLLKERCDGILSIPQHGHVDSLNVSVAAGVFMYELRRRRGNQAGTGIIPGKP
jgi:23S rRNA (guanosine2251-2'-O)-methyltransferase